VNADTSGGGHAVVGAVLGGTAGDGWGRAAAYDAYADGLHTYALWYLHDHDAAADAVYCAFVAADRNHTNLQQPEQIQPWLYALLRHECRLRTTESVPPTPVSRRLRPKPDALDESSVAASLIQLEGSLRRAEFQSLAWAEAEGLAPAHREVLELTIRHGLDSRGLALVLGLRDGAAGLAPTHGFGLLADAWRELERSLAAAAVAASGRGNCAQLAELTFGWSGKLNATLRAPLTEHVDGCSRCQHYLHTVIGTPSAPTILPFVAAPRALRDILLGELADLDAAADAGVDLHELWALAPVRSAPRASPRASTRRSRARAPSNTAGAGRGPRRRQPERVGSVGRNDPRPRTSPRVHSLCTRGRVPDPRAAARVAAAARPSGSRRPLPVRRS
jgi:DNA-directed RNA polymerase specialized sigma24 family protein